MPPLILRRVPALTGSSSRPPRRCPGQRQRRRRGIEQLEERWLLSATALGSEYQVNTTEAYDQRTVAIGSHPQSTQRILAWVSANEDGGGDGVYAQRYDLYGNAIGSPFRVNGTTSGNQTAPSVGMDALGNFVVVWQSSTGDGSGDGIYGRRYGFDATALASQFRVNSTTSGNQQAPSIAMTDDGRFAVAFQSANRDGSGNAVVARVYNAAGSALATDFQVNQTTAGNQQAPAVAMDSSGQFVVAWQSAGQDGDGETIAARRYDSTGSALDAEFVVNQTVSGDQSNPAIAVNGDGTFVVSWQSAGQDGNSDAVVARLYSNSGTPLANEFVVNQYSSGSQSAPSVSSAGATGFVVGWQSAGQDGSVGTIVARQYDAAGTAVGNEWVVNTFTAGAQTNPAVAIESDGDFLVAWQSAGQEPGGGTSLGVFARRYSAAGDAPVLRQVPNQAVDLGETISFVAQADDQDLAIDALSYSLLAGAPAGAAINPSTGEFTWSTASGVLPGRYFVTVRANDLDGNFDDKRVAMTVFAPQEATVLDAFVNAIDPAYDWDIRGRVLGAGFTKYNILLTSGTWRTADEVDKPLWQHWMAVYVPDVITKSRALLHINGGSSSTTPPANSDLDAYAGPMAAATGSVFIDLFNVPSQPLQFAGEAFTRSEDSIIAYSWRKYLETGDPTWPVNLAMTRAAVRAMDAVSDFLGAPVGGNYDVGSFVVAGGSKRGWTTWLASAVDPRVSEAIPVVIDLLNMQASFVHHYAYYNGTFSEAVQDYVDEGILDVDNFGTEGITSLLTIVDPYSYRQRLTLPKYLVNASGDEFFVPDSWTFYYQDLLGPKSVRYLANSSHGISDPLYVLDTLTVFSTIAAGGELPEYDFQQLADGTIELTTAGTVTDAKLWQATNPTARDFRWPVVGAAFSSTPISDVGGGVFQGNVPTPAQGWTAYFIEVSIANPVGGAIKVTSGMYLKGPSTNIQPQLDAIDDVTIAEGSPLSVDPSASDADMAQSLAFNLEAGAPQEVSIDPLTGQISGLWSDQVAGALPITVAVWDDGTPPLPDRKTFRVTVENAAPAAALDGPTTVAPGTLQTYTLLATDPSTVDQAAGFSFDIDWNNDGITDETISGPSGTTANHTFAPGSHVVRVVATDKDGGSSLAATLVVDAGLPGDANGDGFVDGGDYTIWADHYNQTTSQGVSVGDFNLDGTVDGADYTIWADNYAPPAAPAALPAEQDATRSTTVDEPPRRRVADSLWDRYLWFSSRDDWQPHPNGWSESGDEQQISHDAFFAALGSQDRPARNRSLRPVRHRLR